ncbi:MAG: hypothetical protein RLY68_745 [Actinomycetota bacterium]
MIMGISLFFLGKQFNLFADNPSFTECLRQVFVWGLSGSLIYFVLSFVFKIEVITNTYRKIIK